MKSFVTAATLLAATASADLCSYGSTDDNGNYYCQAVNAITYTGVGGSGSYNKVTNMDSTNGACSSSPYGYSGSLSPLDEEVSMHFRGPMQLKQFAVYMPGNSSSSNAPSSYKARRNAHGLRHGHSHAHAHAHMHKERHAEEEEKRDLGAMVTAVIDGKLVSWANQYAGGAAPAAATQPAAAAPAYQAVSSVAAAVPGAYQAVSSAAAAVPAAYQAASSAAASVAGGSGSSSGASSGSGSTSSSPSDLNGAWGRQAYYDSASGTADGLVFLNHQGGTGSGVWDAVFGNSLSYASTNGASGASSPQVLEDCTTASSTEVVIMTDQPCTDGSCGYYRDGTVAYHGFNGPSKAFFYEFGMPSDGQTGASEYDAVNMPAIWMLNAQIPRTLQYGNADCSCWTSGCGEFDIFEVLAAGDTRCKSTLHGNIAGGDSDYFVRPESGTIKAVLLLYNDNIHIKILPDTTDFGSAMSASFLNDIVSSTSTNSMANGVSLFALGG